MESLNHKWTKSRSTGIYHFFRSKNLTYDGTTNSICGSFKISYFYEMSRDFVEEYEILDPTQLCVKCKRLVDLLKHSKKIINEIKHLPIKNNHFLKEVECSEPECPVTGVAFVSRNNDDEEKPHYCIKHNIRVQETIKLEAAV